MPQMPKAQDIPCSIQDYNTHNIAEGPFLLSTVRVKGQARHTVPGRVIARGQVRWNLKLFHSRLTVKANWMGAQKYSTTFHRLGQKRPQLAVHTTA